MGVTRKPTKDHSAGGDPKILAHPSFRSFPECLYPLETKKGRDEYAALGRLLFEGGRLTAKVHRDLSSYAAQFDQIQQTLAAKRPVRAAAFIQSDKARARLKIADLDTPIAAPEDAKTNKFAFNGFPARSRQALR